MQSIFSGVVVDLFTAIFGGFVNYGDGSKCVKMNANPILLTGFILGLLALVITIILVINHKLKFLSERGTSIICVTVVCLFLASGILFALKNMALTNQFVETVKAAEPQITSEELAKLKEYLTIVPDKGTLIFMITQFAGAVFVGASMLVNKLIKE